MTNRDLDKKKTGVDQFGKRPNTEGPNELRMVEVEKKGRSWSVEIVPDKLNAEWKERAGIDTDWLVRMGFDDEPVLHGSVYVAKRLLDRVNPQTGRMKGRNVLLFVHGYNNDMEDVLTRAWGFQQAFGVEVLAFSWPANGGGAISGAASYKSDKHDARLSVGAMDRALAKINDMLIRANGKRVAEVEERALARFPDNPERRDAMITRAILAGCPFKVSMLLHSMGNYLFKHLLLSTASLGNGLIFDNVILTAADTNNNEHDLWTDRIRAHNRVFITINENDAALRVSRIKGGEEQLARLGHYPYELVSDRAAYVDFTGRVGDSHAYFEGNSLANAGIKRFFREAINGEAAEARLQFDVARNLYRF